MANGTVTFTVNSTALNAQDQLQKSIIVRGTATISSASDTYVAGGLVATFTPLESIKSSIPPTRVELWSQPPVGSPNTFYYIYTYNPGSTIQNGQMQIWGGLGSAAEFSGTLTSPGADVILFEATFVRI